MSNRAIPTERRAGGRRERWGGETLSGRERQRSVRRVQFQRGRGRD